MNGQYGIGDIVLGNWKLVGLLGTGAFGKVYEAEREEFGNIYKAAIKIITIPQSKGEVRSALSEGMTEAEVSDYFQDIVKQIVNECAFMSKVKGVTNIVGYEDHLVVPHQGMMGWDIIIRMELLTPLLEHIIKNPLTITDTVRLGMDICRALEVCQKMNIIHRDIKPENIMISELDAYKLGDFGISRTMERTQGGLSKKGTASYMAPEVAKGETYGHTVDIYSLGIVMYRFLNDNRGPFLPTPPAPITYNDREEAQAKRINGEKLLAPRRADAELSRIVLKACAYDAKNRYQSPIQMREELEAWLEMHSEEKESFENDHKQSYMFTEQTAELAEDGDETISAFSVPSGNLFVEEKKESVAEKESSHTSTEKNSAQMEEENFDKTSSVFDVPQNGDNIKKVSDEIAPQEKQLAGGKKRAAKSRKLILVIGCVAVLLLIGGGYYAFFGGTKQGNQERNNQQNSGINSNSTSNYSSNNKSASSSSSATSSSSNSSSGKATSANDGWDGKQRIFDKTGYYNKVDLEKLESQAQSASEKTGITIYVILTDRDYGDQYTSVWDDNTNQIVNDALSSLDKDYYLVILNQKKGLHNERSYCGGKALELLGEYKRWELTFLSSPSDVISGFQNAIANRSLYDYVWVGNEGALLIDSELLGRTRSQIEEEFRTTIRTQPFDCNWTKDGEISAWWSSDNICFAFMNDVLVAMAYDGTGQYADFAAYSQLFSFWGETCIAEKEFYNIMKKGQVVADFTEYDLWLGCWRWDSTKMQQDNYMQQFYGINTVKWFFE